jgi:uncharacterized protein (TIGR03643 family)
MSCSNLDSWAIHRIIEMAWEDRTPFEAIEVQFGIKEKQVIALMRRHVSGSAFKVWRRRVTARKTKHLKKRGFTIGRFKAKKRKS